MTMKHVAAAIIATIAWIGLAVQFGATFSGLGSVSATLWIMGLYFTIIANLAAAIVFSAAGAAYSKVASPFVIGGVTITMLLVGIVYNTLLRGMVELSGGARLADLLNHSVTPLTVGAFWLFMADKGHLGWSAPWKWALLPLAYFLYGLVRGATGGVYPYPFMNLPLIGWGQMLVNAIAIAVCFVIVGYAMVWLDRALAPATKAR